MLVALHFQFQSDRNINLFVDRSVVFYDNWLFQILQWLFLKLLKRSCKDLVSINSRVDLLFICQLKKQSKSHLTPPERPPEHHPSISRTFSISNTIKVKFCIIFSPNPVSGAMFRIYFDTHLICPNICHLILNSQRCMGLCKLKPIFPIEFFKKGTASSYPMIVA